LDPEMRRVVLGEAHDAKQTTAGPKKKKTAGKVLDLQKGQMTKN